MDRAQTLLLAAAHRYFQSFHYRPGCVVLFVPVADCLPQIDCNLPFLDAYRAAYQRIGRLVQSGVQSLLHGRQHPQRGTP